jgi:hypothetical protein
LIEADEDFRRKAARFSDNVHGFYIDEYPVCFVRAAHLRTEIGPKADHGTIMPVLETSRECTQFEPWAMGYTPRSSYKTVELTEPFGKRLA